jgi:hypothetical protein
MRSDFAAFILTHGRPDRVLTYKTLRKCGYTGKIYLLIDDEDKCGDEYRKLYGDQVLTFNKRESLAIVDDGINDDDFRSPLYARNVCFEIAKGLGLKWFVQLDDDYQAFRNRFLKDLTPDTSTPLVRKMDGVLSALVDFYQDSGADSVAMAQGGDWIGGGKSCPTPRIRRKVMNSFIFSVDSKFRFMAKLNDDVTSYVVNGLRGMFCATVMQVDLDQGQTQANPGGLTEIYLENGTYVKSFYSVMYAPSCVKIGAMGDPRSGNYRFHHEIDWPRAVPCILREEHRKGGGRW